MSLQLPIGSRMLGGSGGRRRRRGILALFGSGRRHRSGPSPAECLIPQMQEYERRKRYDDRDVSSHAPSKLIGYVSAGSFKKPGAEQPRRRRRPGGRAFVVALAAFLALVWLGFGGI